MGCYTTTSFNREGGTRRFSYELRNCQGSVMWSSAATPDDGHFSVDINIETRIITVSCGDSGGQERNLTITPNVNGVDCDAICISQIFNDCGCEDFQHRNEESVLVPNTIFNPISCEGVSANEVIGRWYCNGQKECPIDNAILIGENIELRLLGDGTIITTHNILPNESDSAITFLVEFRYNGIKCFETEIVQEGQEEKCNCDYAEHFIKMLKSTFGSNGTVDEMLIASGESKCGILVPRIDDTEGFLEDGFKVGTDGNKFYWSGTVTPYSEYRTLGINFNIITQQGEVLSCNTPTALIQSDSRYCSCNGERYVDFQDLCYRSDALYYDGDIGGDYAKFAEGKYGRRCTLIGNSETGENTILINLNRIDEDEEKNKIRLPSFSIGHSYGCTTATHIKLDENYFCGYKSDATYSEIINKLDYWVVRYERPVAITKNISEIEDGSETLIEMEYYIDVVLDSKNNVMRGYKCDGTTYIKVKFTKDCFCEYENDLSNCCTYDSVDDSYRNEETSKITKEFTIYPYRYDFCHPIIINNGEINKLKLYENGIETQNATIISVTTSEFSLEIYVTIEFEDNIEANSRNFTLSYIDGCDSEIPISLICIEQLPSCSCNAYKTGLYITSDNTVYYPTGDYSIAYLDREYIANCDDSFNYSLSAVTTSADEGLSISNGSNAIYVNFNLDNYGTYNIEYDLYLVKGDGSLVFNDCVVHKSHTLTYAQEDQCECIYYSDKIDVNTSITGQTYYGGEVIRVCTYEKVSSTATNCIRFVCKTDSNNLISLTEQEIGNNKVDVMATIIPPTEEGIYSPTIDMYYCELDAGECRECYPQYIQITIVKTL